MNLTGSKKVRLYHYKKNVISFTILLKTEIPVRQKCWGQYCLTVFQKHLRNVSKWYIK